MSRQTGLLEARAIGLDYAIGLPLLTRRRKRALEDVSFRIEAGQSVAVLGLNGSGKSTLLRVLAGVVKPDRGTLQNSIGRAALLSLRLGMVPHLTGRENAIMTAMLLGFRRSEILPRLDAIREFSELGAAFEQPTSSYSDGMLARLGFAATFFFDPSILLVDEAFAVGDGEFRQKTVDAMIEKIRSSLTVVFVSHNLGLVRRLCDHAIWLEAGRVRAVGATGEIADRYEADLAERAKHSAK